MTSPVRGRRLASIALVFMAFVCGPLAPAAAAPASRAKPAPAKPAGKPKLGRVLPDSIAISRLEGLHAQALWRHRPDLAEAWGVKPYSLRFTPLDEATLDAHVRAARHLLAATDTLATSARRDTLRARLERDLADCAPGGALRRDALVWLDIVAAAVRAPFALGSASGCDRTRRATLQLAMVPEALRGAIVLLRGAVPPAPATLEPRLTSVEQLLRADLPKRTEACKESRRLAEFVEADTLAAASLAQFRDRLASSR